MIVRQVPALRLEVRKPDEHAAVTDQPGTAVRILNVGPVGAPGKFTQCRSRIAVAVIAYTVPVRVRRTADAGIQEPGQR